MVNDNRVRVSEKLAYTYVCVCVCARVYTRDLTFSNFETFR